MDTIYKSIDSATSSTTFLPQQQQQQQRQQQQRQQQQVDDRPTTSSSQDRETLLPRSRLDYHPGRAELSMDSRTINDSNRHPLRGKPRKLVTYIIDWILVIGFIIAFVAIDAVHGHQREFSLTDQSIMYTMAQKETVPTWLLVVCAVVAPIAILLFWTLFIPPVGSQQRQRWRKGEITWTEKVWDANLSLLGIGLAVASTITVTNTFKNLVGRPRPDFLDRCQPPLGAANPTIFTLSSATICTRTTYLKDGFRSFPSGHSSLSFAGLGFLSLFIAGRLNVLDTRGQVWKTIFALAPLVAAGFIAVSRLMDNRHHPFDVIVGSTLGMLLAWMAYRQYFPPIALAEGGRPYSLAEFATDKAERQSAVTSGYMQAGIDDLEMQRRRGGGPATSGPNEPSRPYNDYPPYESTTSRQ